MTANDIIQRNAECARKLLEAGAENEMLRALYDSATDQAVRYADEIARLMVTHDELLALFRDHYWDSLQKDRDIILLHVEAVLARRAVEQKP